MRILADAADVVLAADIEDAYLEHAKKLSHSISNLTCIRDDIIDTKLPDGKFDLILCTEVLEHITNSQAVLQRLYQLHATDETLINPTPQRYSLLEIFAKIVFPTGCD